MLDPFESKGLTFLDILFQLEFLFILSYLNKNSLKFLAVVFGLNLDSTSSSRRASSF
jgi:hypothetical protein